MIFKQNALSLEEMEELCIQYDANYNSIYSSRILLKKSMKYRHKLNKSLFRRNFNGYK